MGNNTVDNLRKGCITFIAGADEYSENTCECGSEYAGCIYQINGRCCYNVSTIQVSSSKACMDVAYADGSLELD